MAHPRPIARYYSACATVRTPYYGHRELPEHYQQYNRDHARLRAPGEHAFARPKSWRLDGGRLGRIVGPWICDPLPPSPIHPHSRDCRARPAPAAKESIAEVNGAYDQVLALLSGAKA